MLQVFEAENIYNVSHWTPIFTAVRGEPLEDINAAPEGAFKKEISDLPQAGPQQTCATCGQLAAFFVLLC